MIALTLLQPLAGVAWAAGPSPAAPTSAPALFQSATPAAFATPVAALDGPREFVVEASSPEQAIARVSSGLAVGLPPDQPSLDDYVAAGGDRVPLADTDNNSIDDARWLNGSASWTGESVDGAAVGQFGRVDVDWWKFPLGNSTLSSADVIEFDIQKQANEHLFAILCMFPSFMPGGFDCRFTSDRVAQYAYMNSTQGWGTNTHMRLTAFEDALYFLYIYSPRRNGCCVVNYTITNVTQYTVTGDVTIDDNSNASSADAFNPAAMPTNEEVVQNHDPVDLFDLTGQIPITPAMGDYSRVTVSAQFTGGGTGWSEYFNTSQTPAVASPGDTIAFGTLWLLYPDRNNVWRVFTDSNVPGASVSITTLVNGTPIYTAVTVVGAINVGGLPLSSVPGSLTYSYTAFSHFDDLAPRQSSPVPDASMNEDDPASGMNLINLAANFTDDFDAAALWFDLQYNQQPSKVFVNFTGTWLMVATAPNWYGTAMLQVRAHDLGLDRVRSGDDHATLSNYFDVVVQPVNDAPVIASVGGVANSGAEIPFSVAQGASLALELAVTDADGPQADTFTVPGLPSFATFFPGNGTVVFSPQNGDVGVYHFVETVTDPGLATGTASYSLTVTNVNDNPRFVEVGGLTLPGTLTFYANEDQPFSLVLRVSDPDWDIGVRDRLLFGADKPFFAFASDPLDGRINTTTFTPTNAQVGTVTVTFTVTDGASGSVDDSVTVTIVVDNTNDAPAITRVGTVQGEFTVGPSKSINFTGVDGAVQGREFPFTVRADDIDVSAGHADTLTFTTDLGAKVQVSANPDLLSADFAFTPNQTDANRGYVLMTIRVTDSGNPRFFDEITMRVAVLNMNDAPVITPVFSINLTEDEAFVFVFEAVDPDGDSVEFSSDSPLVPVDSLTGSIDVTLRNDDIGGEDSQFDMTVRARDNHAGVSSITVHVFIFNANDAPTGTMVAPLDGSTWGPNEGIAFEATGTDADKDEAGQLLFRWYADDVLIGEGRSLVKGIENPGQGAKVVNIRLEIVDPHGASFNRTATITVNGTPPPKSPGLEAPLVALAVAGAAVVVAATVRRSRRHDK